VDGTIVRAHQQAAGAHSGSAEADALGRSQGGFSTKVHIRAEGGGKLRTRVLPPGQRHEAIAFEALMAGGAVKRGGCGRPKRRPRRLVGDKAYSSGKIRQYLRRHGIRITIPRKQKSTDLSRLLLGILMAIRVLARSKPDRNLLEGMARPALATLD